LATSWQDKKIRIYDPRDEKTAQVTNGFGGTKKSTVLFADNHGLVIGVGANDRAMRRYVLWDPRNFDAPVATTDIDSNAGVFIAHYDPDNSILWLSGKGESSIKYYELCPEEKDGKTLLFPLTEYRDSNSQQGVAFLPKRAVDVLKCEIASVLRLQGNDVIPMSFQVPRKSDLFQKDLFPDTYAGIPSGEAKDWFDGKNFEPQVRSMKPGQQQENKQAPAASFVKKKSPAEYEAEIEELQARVKQLEAQLAAR